MRVLITNAVPADHLTPLEGVAEVIQGPSGGDIMSRDEVLELLPDIDGIINQAELKVDGELLARGAKLGIVANVAIGTDNLDKQLMAAKGVWATNVPDAFVDSAADCALGLLLTLARRIHEADAYVRSGEWKSFQPGVWDGVELRGKTWGIVGYGKIGRAVGDRARAFGAQVIAYDPAAESLPEYRPLEKLLAEAEIVSIHVPLLPATRGLFDEKRLRSMKRGALLVNISRGPVVVEDALARLLSEGHLAGAALDVFEKEPQVHPDLIQMKNVVLTPHIGGGTRESRKRARLLCAENVARVLTGKEPITPVNRPVTAIDDA